MITRLGSQQSPFRMSIRDNIAVFGPSSENQLLHGIPLGYLETCLSNLYDRT